ncbi:MAG: hypothetical protein IPM46_02755 [Flavobacteriales bacterium]|nr:hypothetical protein [Flavobacteriales bacterium]
MNSSAFILWATALLLPAMGHAQDLGTDKENQAAVRKLAFIVGDWKGEGWMMGPDGQRHAFTQTETIRFKLDSTVIYIEGLGTSEGRITHNAMAIISNNKRDGHYTFRSYLANGREGAFKAELLGDKLYWYPKDDLRYIIHLNEKGQWYETGEMKRGEQWFQFFEMTLDRQP